MGNWIESFISFPDGKNDKCIHKPNIIYWDIYRMAEEYISDT